MADRLRHLWDFDDLEASEGRFTAQLESESAGGRAEVLTQLARIEGLRGEFEAGERLIEEAEGIAGTSPVAQARVDLERGRLRRSSGSVEAALPLFESAFAIALEAGEYFIAADAAHMAALVAPDPEGFVSWTERGIDLAETHDGARHWIGTLLNNLGWEYYDAGDYDSALSVFERALAARMTFPENRSAIAFARYGVGKALRSLGRSDEAIPLLEEAVAWADGSSKPDGWFHEELALEYAEAGRADDARAHAALAVPLLNDADPALAEDAERSSRLRDLAHG